MTINMGELFAGIGGFYQGFKNVFKDELTVVYANEWDKFANSNYEILHGVKPEISDIREVDETKLPQLDLLTLGTPCVSFSHAGCQLGFDDMRGTVFFDAMRIAKEKQPKVVLVENVKGLINNDKGNSIKRILETMNDIGYYVDFELLDSKYYQVAQQRERVYIVGIRKDLIKEGFWKKSYTTPALTKRKDQLSHIESFAFDWDYGSNPSVVFSDIQEKAESKYHYSKEHINTFAGEENFKEKLQNKSANNKHTLTLVGKIEGLKGNDSIKRVYSCYSYLPTLTTMEGGHRQPKIAYFKEGELKIRKATPKECWLAQGFTEEQFKKAQENKTSDAQLYKQSGNAVTVNVIESIANVIKHMKVLE